MTLARPLRSLLLFVLCLINLRNNRQRPDQAGPRSESADRSGIHQQDSRVYNRALFQLASDRLSARVADVPTPKAVLGDVAGAPGKLPYAEDVYKYMRMLERAQPARESLFDRHDGRRPRDDRRRDRLRATDVETRGESRPADETRRSAHDQHGRSGSRSTRGRFVSSLLHHRRDSLARNRFADSADGTGLSARRR